ncbi:MAG: hypothetical protein AB7G12_03690 [Thermoanaerobaculia bacterium]
MRRLRGAISLLALVSSTLLVAAPAQAWKPETQEAIALAAARIAPPDLARQIARRERSYLAGVREPLSADPASRHVKNGDGSGELDTVIAAELAAAVREIQMHHPFDDVVHRLGRISHFIADANLPLNTANTDRNERVYFRDFLDYAESARPRFAVVFYALGDDWRSSRDIENWTRGTLARGRRLYGSIGEEYRRTGMLPGVRGFDDHSTAFAVAAVAYSHSISDVARALRYVWLAAGGGDGRFRNERDRERLMLLEQGGAR